jgi:hypothetical protein
VDLPDHGGETRLAQTLLHGREHVGLAPRLSKDEAVGMQADGCEARREQVAPLQAPEHRPFEASGDAGGEEHGRGCHIVGGSRLKDLVHSSTMKAGCRQMAVEHRHTERKHRP